jgi:CRISPR-associated exonuclease Cas4
MTLEILVPLGLALLLIGLVLWVRSAQKQRDAGLPQGRVIYSDTGMWKKVEQPLYDPLLDLTGRPDYLVEQNGRWIPVEVKSAFAPAEPYDSHVLQLAAYCLLVERTMGRRPSHGILKYRNRTFSIDYTAALEDELIDLLSEMRLSQQRGEEERSHDLPGRCDRCGFRKICNQKL